MAEDVDWLFALVKEGMLSYQDLQSSEISLADCALMSDYLTVRAENQARINQVMARERREE